jgi:glycosyltransferase involved in cell wall biosynthesis
VLTPAFREKLIEKGIDREKIWFVPNGADLDIFQPGERENWVRKKYMLDDKFVVTYLGAHGVANHLITIIEAARKLKDNQDIVFMLIGDGMQKEMLKAKSKEYELKNVIFVDNQPKDKVVDFCNAMDVGAAVLQKNDIFKTVYPNKVFDYMSCAKPVLLNIDGVAREMVVSRAKAGVFAKPGDDDDFVEKVLYLYKNREEGLIMGKNGYDFVVRNFSRETLAAAYEEHFLLLAGQEARQ